MRRSTRAVAASAGSTFTLDCVDTFKGVLLRREHDRRETHQHRFNERSVVSTSDARSPFNSALTSEAVEGEVAERRSGLRDDSQGHRQRSKVRPVIPVGAILCTSATKLVENPVRAAPEHASPNPAPGLRLIAETMTLRA
jgi:hypothetical protein